MQSTLASYYDQHLEIQDSMHSSFESLASLTGPKGQYSKTQYIPTHVCLE